MPIDTAGVGTRTTTPTPTGEHYHEIVATFHSAESLEQAISALASAGWDRSEMSLLAQHGMLSPEPMTDTSAQLADDERTKRDAVISDPDMRQGRALAAGMAGVVGAFVASGATILTGGTALAAVIGAAVVGGGAGAAVDAIGRRLDHRHSDHLRQQVEQGGILLWARLRDPEQEATARRILQECGAADIHVHHPADEPWAAKSGGDADGKAAAGRRKRDPVEQASLESFPASDPPSWIPSTAGSCEGAATPDEAEPGPPGKRK